MKNKVHVKTGDMVMVINGKEKGKKGKVIAVSPKEGKIIVEKINKVKKHVKPRKMGEPGGIIEAEAAMYSSKVQILCSKCGPVRIKHNVLSDGSKERVCAKCGASLERRGN